jgi:tetratricopeptide (TPR) repeat protein
MRVSGVSHRSVDSRRATPVVRLSKTMLTHHIIALSTRRVELGLCHYILLQQKLCSRSTMTNSSILFERICKRANKAFEDERYDRARDNYVAALEEGGSHLPDDARFGILEMLGSSCFYANDLEQAEKHDRTTLLELESSLEYGVDHDSTMEMRYNLARDLAANNGRRKSRAHNEAVTLHQKNIDLLKAKGGRRLMRSFLGNSDPGQSWSEDEEQKIDMYLRTHEAMSDALAKLGKHSDANSGYERALQLATKGSNGDLDNRTINLRHKQARELFALERFKDAKRLFQWNKRLLKRISDDEKAGIEAVVLDTNPYIQRCVAAIDAAEASASRSDSPQASDESKVDSCASAGESQSPQHQKKKPRDAEIESQRSSAFSSPPPVKRSSKASHPDSPIRQSKSDEPLRDSGPQLHLKVPSKSTRSLSSEQLPKRSTNKRRSVGKSDTAAASPDDEPGPVGTSKETTKSASMDDERAKHLSVPRNARLPQRSRSTADHRSKDDDAASSTQHHRRSNDGGRIYRNSQTENEADAWFERVRSYTHDGLLYPPDKASRDSRQRRVRVAVLDTGVTFSFGASRDPKGPKIWPQVRRNRILNYRDFTGDTPERADSATDYHGTKCVLTLLQMAPETDVYVANVIPPGDGGPGESGAQVANAIAWAVEREVDIISMSFGWNEDKESVKKQIELARRKGILIFAAAWNDGIHAPKHGVFPARHPTVTCVYSCTGNGRPSYFNTWDSKNKANFMFLGEDIAVIGADDRPVEDVGRVTGTSFATPIAAGTAALVLELVRSYFKRDLELIEKHLKTYEGISSVLHDMSDYPTGTLSSAYRQITPWRMLCKNPSPLKANSRDPALQYAAGRVINCLHGLKGYEDIS